MLSLYDCQYKICRTPLNDIFASLNVQRRHYIYWKYCEYFKGLESTRNNLSQYLGHDITVICILPFEHSGIINGLKVSCFMIVVHQMFVSATFLRTYVIKS